MSLQLNWLVSIQVTATWPLAQNGFLHCWDFVEFDAFQNLSQSTHANIYVTDGAQFGQQLTMSKSIAKEWFNQIVHMSHSAMHMPQFCFNILISYLLIIK